MSESDDLEITIANNQAVTLANPVTVRITPLTVPEALASGVITSFDDDDSFSPNRAGKMQCTTIITSSHLVMALFAT